MTMQRRTVWQAAAAWGLLGLVGCGAQGSATLAGMDMSGSQQGKDVTPLRDADGRPRTLADFAGKVVVVFFGYVQCPDVCPTTLQELVEAKALLGAQGDRLQGVFITVDPTRDTPQVLKAYTQAFGADIVGLTGTPEEIAQVARDFKVFYKKVPGSDEASYTIDHSAGMYMYDPQGKLRVYHRYGQGAQALAQDAKILLAQ